MRFWRLPPDSPTNLTLSADFRTSQPDYTNDQIWELCMGDEPPRALALRTTYGLRAGSMLLFPRFLAPQADRMDPSLFPGAPIIRHFLPNYLDVHYQPIAGLDIDSAFWVAESQLVIGRLTFTNSSGSELNFQFEWICQLKPLNGGQSMTARTYGINNVLQGQTEDVFPVCVMTGGAQPGFGPYPALTLQVDLLPGQKRQIQWAIASHDTPQKSFETARLATARRWDAEIARLSLINDQNLLEIYTGDPEWDACLAQAQTTAYRLIFPASTALPNPSFVLSRQPDHGYSLRKDGSDYHHLWNGQTALDALYLSGFLLPGGAMWVKGFIENFLSTQTADGQVDWKPGLSGQRAGMLAQPVLAAIAWEAYQDQRDLEWLRRVFPALMNFVRAWFSPAWDADQDAYPEWRQPLQSGFPDSPLYDPWHEESAACEIQQLECPSLAAMLYHECDCLLRFARLLNEPEADAWLEEKMNALRAHLSSVWDARASTYHYRDAVSHLTQAGSELRRFKGAKDVSYRRVFKKAVRLQVRLLLAEPNSRPLQIEIQGSGDAGPIHETLLPAHFTWLGTQVTASTQNLYTRLERVRIQGLAAEEETVISILSHQAEDLSCLLPLWAGVPTPSQAEKIIRRNLLPRYLGAYGLALSPTDGSAEQPGHQRVVPVIWNDLILRGLLRYGHPKEALTVFTHLMEAFIAHLKQDHVFHAAFHAETGRPAGDENALPGLPPLGLFLRLCGIRRISPEEVILEGENVFPWPVALKYKGMTITRHANDCVIRFASGQSLTVEGPGPHRVKLMVDPHGKES
ncbi:MGH1-like glycoside hydrolase domain-containing protein [Ornatilinea apprima]|nr:hypothetical protein [Ornatilinea apprima]